MKKDTYLTNIKQSKVESMFSYNFGTLPFIGMTGKTKEKNGWSHNGRIMPTNMLVIIHSGKCTFEINKKTYTYKGGEIVIVPKGIFYAPHTDTFCEYTFFHFDGDFTECHSEEIKITPFEEAPFGQPGYGIMERGDLTLLFDYKITLGEKMQDIELLLRKCANAQHAYGSKMHLILAVLFSEMMFYISEAYCQQFSSEKRLPPAANKILAYINENYTREITLDDICAQTNVSKQYCMKLFKKYMHTTINDYILNLRMRHAVYLLRWTYMNVNQTANYLGFSSVSYFSRVFKKYFGIPPSAYFE